MNKKHSLGRYKLWGSIMWCLNWKNGWVRVGNMMFRWNTDWKSTYMVFGIEHMTRRAK